jgi:GAF domain-containing protein
MSRGPKSTNGKAKPAAPRTSRKNGAGVRELEKRLAESLEQQKATSEILRAISGSLTDVQPVLDIIALNAARVCGARDGALLLKDEADLCVASHHGPLGFARHNRQTRIPIGRDWVSGRSVLEKRAIQVEDLLAVGDEYPRGLEMARIDGHRTTLATPLLREGEPIGVLLVRRGEVRLFTPTQMELLQTFADQAVIAIENVRLFKELEEKNRALTQAHAQVSEALDTQTATSEILRVISSSPTDVQPVFEAIAASATRLCDGVYSVVFRYDGEVITVAADNGRSAETSAVIRSAYPAPPGRGTLAGRALLERRLIAMTNAQDSRENPDGAERARALGYGAGLSVPMMRGDVAIGVINVLRVEATPFTDTQIQLLQTFADQAVIAIENVRLFTELQEKNKALTQAHAQVTETLERQTATSEILRVISSSPTDVNPVFRTVLANANRLCDASFSVLWRWDGEAPTAVAHENVSPAMAEALRTARPLPNRRSPLGLSILEQTVVHVADVLTDPRFTPEDVPSYRLEGARSILCVPMVREGSLVGLINIWRREPRAFTDGQIALVRTFADQAVIAIENVRLFKELESRNRDLTATSEILQVISHSPTDIQPVFTALATSAARLCDAFDAAIHRMDGDVLRIVARRTN